MSIVHTAQPDPVRVVLFPDDGDTEPQSDPCELRSDLEKEGAAKIDDLSTVGSTTVDGLAKLADGMTIAGCPLPCPHFHPVDWVPGQHFEEADDPDRTRLPWSPPEFVTKKDPISQRAKTTVEHIDFPGLANLADGSFARVVHGVFDADDCLELINAVNTKGFTPALLNTGGGTQRLDIGARNGHRVIADSPELTKWIFDVIQPALPEQLFRGHLVELNERCRFLCYTPGQSFPPHCDGCYTRPPNHPNAFDRSRVTLQIYLHDVPAENGGATSFLYGSWGNESGVRECQPRAGSVLLFTQNLYHEGSLVKGGLKYTLRTEAMYRHD